MYIYVLMLVLLAPGRCLRGCVMPSRPRGETVLEGEVGVYHCWSRCVRRAFLCGQDPYSGKDYGYRRDWIRQFQERLAGLFGIEIGFHAEMSNHILCGAPHKMCYVKL